MKDLFSSYGEIKPDYIKMSKWYSLVLDGRGAESHV